jgi:hypothetical protein
MILYDLKIVNDLQKPFLWLYNLVLLNFMYFIFYSNLVLSQMMLKHLLFELLAFMVYF